MPVEEKFYGATLVNGEIYVLGDKTAEKGKEIKVSEFEKEHLEEHAVDTFPVGKSGDNMVRQKFEFRPLADGEDVSNADAGKVVGKAAKPVAPARARSRS